MVLGHAAVALDNPSPWSDACSRCDLGCVLTCCFLYLGDVLFGLWCGAQYANVGKCIRAIRLGCVQVALSSHAGCSNLSLLGMQG